MNWVSIHISNNLNLLNSQKNFKNVSKIVPKSFWNDFKSLSVVNYLHGIYVNYKAFLPSRTYLSITAMLLIALGKDISFSSVKPWY